MHRILHPKDWAPAKGFSHGIAVGRQVFIAGQVGSTAGQGLIGSDFVAQAEQALRNILAVLAEAGGEARDLVRLTWYVADRREYLARARDLGQAYRRVLGRHFPAMTLVEVGGLVDEGAKVEIEATAVLPEAKA
jgi:enamine deaminase RidA (YjgF/YER057c/UK114 family)